MVLDISGDLSETKICPYIACPYFKRILGELIWRITQSQIIQKEVNS